MTATSPIEAESAPTRLVSCGCVTGVTRESGGQCRRVRAGESVASDSDSATYVFTYMYTHTRLVCLSPRTLTTLHAPIHTLPHYP